MPTSRGLSSSSRARQRRALQIANKTFLHFSTASASSPQYDIQSLFYSRMRKRNFLFITALLYLACSGIGCRRAPEGTSVNLLQQLSQTELVWNTRVIHAGSPAFAPALAHGWEQIKEPDGTTAAYTEQLKASIGVSVFEPSDRTLAIRCKSANAANPLVILAINGRKLRPIRPDTNYKEFRIEVSAKLLRTGLNTLTFTSAGKFSVATFAIVEKGSLAQETDSKFDQIYPETVQGKKVTGAPVPGSIAVYTRLPEKSTLQIKYGILPDSKSSGTQVEMNVSLEDVAGKKTTLISRVLKTSLFSFSSGSNRIPLDDFGNHIVRIVFAAREIHGKSAPDRIYWEEAQLFAPESKPAPTGTGTDRAKSNARKPNVFIYTIDALRADALEPYGYPKPTSPRIREFARDAAVFENAYANVSWTRASVATILTGLYPSSHLTEGRLNVLPGFLPTIQGELKRNGYSVFGFTTNGNISPDFNFKKDFDRYIHLRESNDRIGIHVQSGELVDALGFFLNETFAQPGFIYIHATDPHEPHMAEPRFLQVPPDCKINDPKIFRPSTRNFGAKAYSEEDVACVRALYDSEVRQSDYYFGKFLDLLKEKHLYDNSLIILTADHGEALFEHGTFGHGQTLYQTELHVPLLMHFPGSQYAGKRITGNARHIDLFPTILDLISAKIPPGVQGSSLLPLLSGQEKENRFVFSELLLDRANRKCLIVDHYKMLEIAPGGNRSRFEMYDVASDPMETIEISDQQPVLSGYMRMTLHQWAEVQAKRKATLQKPRDAVLDKETEETLRALGYLQ